MKKQGKGKNEMMTREEWLDKRRLGITGTGAAAIMGCSPYSTSVEYWQEKIGEREPSVDEEDPFIKYGKDSEIHLIELFKMDYPEFAVFHQPYDLRVHDGIPYLMGSLDGELTEKSTGRRGVLEIKTALIHSHPQALQWKDGVPVHYFWQCIHNMIVINADFVVIKAQLKFFSPEGHGFRDVRLDTRHYYFERKEVQYQIDELLKRELAFWEHVKNRTRPPLSLPRI